MWMPLGKPEAPGLFHMLKGAYGQNKVCKEREHAGGDGWRRLFEYSPAAVLLFAPFRPAGDAQGGSGNERQLTACRGLSAGDRAHPWAMWRRSRARSERPSS
jgi:hypothetical protein